MITVYDYLPEFCKEENLPPPTQSDFEHCGRILSRHFKSFWGPKQSFPEGQLIPDSGFLLTDKNGVKIIVQAYPDSFKNEMYYWVKTYFLKKQDPPPPPPQKEPPPAPKQRKRMPAGAKKAASSADFK